MRSFRALALALLLAPALAGCTGQDPAPSTDPVTLVAEATFGGEPLAVELDPRNLTGGGPGMEKLRSVLDEIHEGFERTARRQVTDEERHEVERFLDARWAEARWEGQAQPPRPDPMPVLYKGRPMNLTISG